MTSSDIARWPSWSRLRFEHKPLLDALASPDPYCDWTFATLWSWDTEEEIALARLGDGLALRLPSYPLGGPEEFSFNGRPGASVINAFVAEHREVSLVPKPVVDGLALTNCAVTDDRDQYDYVYDVTECLGMEGARFVKARNALRRSTTRNPDAKLTDLDPSDPGVARELLDLFDAWAGHREDDTSVERRALVRCLDAARPLAVRCAAVTGPDGLLAFALVSQQPGHWAGAPFAKRHPRAPDVGLLLWRAVLGLADALRVRWLNYEQDLGNRGLRQHKKSLGPARMLEKVRLVPTAAG